MIFVVLTQDTPGDYRLLDTYDAANPDAALEVAATEHPETDVFFVQALADFRQERVAGRRMVVDWQPALGAP